MFAGVTSEEDEGFGIIYDQLIKYRESPVVEYIYTMRQTGPQTSVFVIDTDPEEPGALGEEYDWLEVFETVYSGTGAWDPEMTVDEWGVFISGYAPIFNSANKVVGLVGVDVSLSQMESDVAVVGKLIMLLISIFIAVFIGIALVIGITIGKNMKRLYEKVHDLNSGDADLTKQIVINSGDELETIAVEINTFIAHIRDQLKGAAGTSEKVAANSESMESLVEECRGSLSGIADDLQKLSTSMKNTSTDTSAILDGINESHALVGKTYENANSKAEKAKKISTDALAMQQEIMKKTVNATDMVAGLKAKLEEAALKCQAVHEIEELTERILKVSNTTKMLSLNASIEAARAGEAGRGFAIIAGDVQELSSQITELVEHIRQTNEQVIISVEALIKNVEETTGFLNDEVLSDYRDYRKMGSDYSENMSDMATALKDINENLEKVNGSIDMISDRADSINTVVMDSSEKVESVAKGSMVLEGNMNDLTQKAIHNNEEAKNLNDNIAEYKL